MPHFKCSCDTIFSSSSHPFPAKHLLKATVHYMPIAKGLSDSWTLAGEHWEHLAATLWEISLRNWWIPNSKSLKCEHWTHISDYKCCLVKIEVGDRSPSCDLITDALNLACDVLFGKVIQTGSLWCHCDVTVMSLWCHCDVSILILFSCC